ncbi:MAG: efflux RND transporter periplasmic adaptor subunit [Micropepsaceae bacterium]
MLSWRNLFIALVVLGVGYFAWRTAFPPAPAAPAYQTAKAEIGDIQQVAQANGTLNPVSVINVGTQISGVVKAVKSDYNELVDEGQVLAELDTRLLDASLASSRAQLKKAQAASHLARLTYERRKSILDAGGASKNDVDTAAQQVASTEADAAIAAASVKRDETNLGFAVIRAPVAGVVLSRDVDVGQTVAASFQTPTLFRISPNLRSMQINTNLSEADVGTIKQGQGATFTVDAFPGKNYAGTVRQVRLNPTTVQNVVTYNAVIDVDNPSFELLPGMTAFARIRLGEAKQVLKVPNAALRYRPKEPGDGKARGGAKEERKPTVGNAVHVLRAGKPVRVPVTPGLTDGKFTQIAAGDLKAGDEVITGEETPGGGNGSGGQVRVGGGPPR